MSSETEAHVRRLDELFERYLSLLDAYQTAQSELSASLSTGFLNLAQANRSAPAGVRRYGQDYYDNRMQASRRVQIDEDGKMSLFSVVESSCKESSEPEEKDGPASGDSEDGANGASPSDLTAKVEKEAKSRKARDPIRWFGFSVPSTLRVAQAKFTGAVEHPIPRILHVTKDMRQLENEIGRLRKTIKKLERS